MTNTIDHTGCVAYGLHDASAKGRAWCRKHPLRRTWVALTQELEYAGGSDDPTRRMMWHSSIAAEENAVMTLQEEGIDITDYRNVETERYYDICWGSYESLLDMHGREGTEF